MRTVTLRIGPRGILVLAALAALVTAPAAQATNGYFTHGYGTASKALAGAGVALPQDAMAAATNPAGMAFVGKRFDAGLALFNPNREYTVSGSPTGPPFFGLVPGNVESDSEYFLIPFLAGNWEFGTDATIGFNLYGHGGMNTDYNTATFFASSPTGVNLSQLFISGTYARKFGGGNHAFGITPVFVYQQFEIEGVGSFAQFSSDPARLSNKGADASTGFGAKLGYLGQITPAFSVGVSYQTKMSMEEFDDYAGLFAEQGGFDIPSSYTVGFAFQAGSGWTFLLDYQEIFYSDVDSVHNPLFPNLGAAFMGDPNSLLGGSTGPGFGWQDMSIVKAGVQWEPGSDWIWRFGVSVGDQPIPTTEMLFNILAPGVMEEHITLGFTRLMGSRAINLSLLYAPASSVSGPNPLEVPGLQTIELEMNQWDIEFSYSWGI